MINIQAPGAIWKDWIILEQIGRDSVGDVFRAQTMDSQAQSAVKQLRVQMAGLADADDFEMRRDGLSNAVASMIRLNGTDHIMPIEDSSFGEMDNGMGLEAYVRTPLLQNLTEYLSGMGQPSRALIIRIGIDIAMAINELQNNGLVHRNLKPAAIYYDGNGGFCLGNLWMVCSLDAPNTAWSTGTPNFMAPEILNRQVPVSRTMDLYSLGMVLYRLLNRNHVPFLQDNVGEKEALYIRMRGEPVPAPMEADPQLAAVICRCLAFDPAQRYQTGAELAGALEQLLNPYATVENKPEVESYWETAQPKKDEPAQPKGFRQFRMTRR